MTLTTVLIKTADGHVETFGETTASRYLFVVADIRDGQLTGVWSLIHGPSGCALSDPDWAAYPTELQMLAANIAHLDWSDFESARDAANIEHERDEARYQLEHPTAGARAVTRIGTGVLLGDPDVGSTAWHDLRRPMVNGSEIAAVLGISPYESPFSLWHRKAGNLGGVLETPEMYWGKQLEDVIRGEFNRRNGRAFQSMGQFRHRDREWQGGAPDGVDNEEIFEAKTDRYGDRWGEEGTDEIPAHYRAQILWYLDVLGFDICHVAVLIAGSEYREYLVRYNADEAAFMREAAVKFLDSLAGDPPPLDGHDATYQAVRELHPDIDGGEVDLDPDVALPYLPIRTVSS